MEDSSSLRIIAHINMRNPRRSVINPDSHLDIIVILRVLKEKW